MPDVRDVFRMATQQAEPDSGALERQHRRQRRADNRRKIGAFTAVAAIAAVILVGVVLLANRDGRPDEVPATQAPGELRPGLFLVDLTTGGRTPFPDPGPQTGDFAFSPDGTRLAFTEWKGGNPEIFVMDVDGTDRHVVSDNPFEAAAPAWSPDGTELAYRGIAKDGSHQIFVLDLATGLSTRVTRGDDADGPVWKDASTIVFRRIDGSHTIPEDGHLGHVRLWTVDLVTGATSPLVDDAFGVTWSPDRSKMIVAHDGGGPFWLEMGNPDGTDLRRVPGADGLTPIWSRDGSLVVFTGQTWNGQTLVDAGLSVYDVATGEVRRILDGVQVVDVANEDTVLVATLD